MRCSSCNSELIPGARFCDACGAPVEPAVEPQKPVDAPEVIPFESFDPVIESSSPQKISYEPSSSASTSSGQEVKTLGIPNSKMGLASVILGGVGLLLSCIGCGGLISLAGLVAGFLALKTPDKKMGTIGLILSGLGVLATLALITLLLIFFFLTPDTSGYYYY